MNLKSAATLPENANTKILPVRLQVTLEGAPLTVVDRLDVARRDLIHWMVIGSFRQRQRCVARWEHPSGRGKA